MAERPTSRPSHDQRLLRESLDFVTPVADELIAAFYDRLFTAYPRLRPMSPAILDPRRQMLKVIIALVAHYDDPQELLPMFAAMGRHHERFGMAIEHYAGIGTVLIGTLRDFAGTGWTPRHEGAWARAYTFAAASMMQAGTPADEEDQRLAA